jgi:formamidopyrimidine-DNA glycosylase
MPEGPEVETIRRGLAENIVGRTIIGVEVLTPKTFAVPGLLIEELVDNQKIISVERRGKVLIWNLSGGHSLMFHLKMTGQVVVVRASGDRLAGGHPSKSMAETLPDSTTRVIFYLGNDDIVYFNDMRKFGWIKLVPTDEVGLDPLVARLGPEPLTSDFTLAGFKAIIKRRKGSPIKPVILDQTTVSGVGNIYADESLHLAKIYPGTLAGDLTSGQVKSLYEAIITIIGLGVEHGGTSFAHYVNSLGGTGDYLDHARVFRREGTPCPVCGTEIVKMKLAGRGTHYCPKCQKPPNLKNPRN